MIRLFITIYQPCWTKAAYRGGDDDALLGGTSSPVYSPPRKGVDVSDQWFRECSRWWLHRLLNLEVVQCRREGGAGDRYAIFH